MEQCSWKKREIIFPAEYHEEIGSYLKGKTVSEKRLVISVKAYQFPSRGLEKLFFLCKFEQGETHSKLTWKSYFSPVEAIVVAIFLLMCIGGLIRSVLDQQLNRPVSVVFVLLVFSLVISVIMYYYWLYRYCNKEFVNDITAKIETIRQEISER